MKFIWLLLVGFLLSFTSCSTDQHLLDNPEKNDIYIFEEEGIYSPVMVDSVEKEIIYCVNSRFVFADAIPKLTDLPKSDFDFTFQLIYKKSEIKRLYTEGKIVAIYRESN